MSYNRLLDKRDASEDMDMDGHTENLCPSCQRLGRFRRRLSSLSAVILPVAILIILAVVALNLAQTYKVKDAVELDINHSFYGNDRSYMSLDHKYDSLWEGYREEAGKVMYPLEPGGEEVVGTIGMFHALHCLAMFRKALQRASAGEKIGVDDLDDGHWPHCMHYVRQHIHCTADDTVERLKFANGSLGAPSITGQWDVRRCGRSDKVYQFEKEHAACWRDDGSHGRCS